MCSVLCVECYTCSATIRFTVSFIESQITSLWFPQLISNSLPVIILPQIIHMHAFRIACLINIESILLYHGCFSSYGCDGTTYK